MSSAMNNYLIAFDRSTGHQVLLEEYGTDSAAAIKRYQELELEHYRDRHLDIVLVGSESLESVKVTHASYFAEGLDVAGLEDYLRDFASQFGIQNA